MTNNNNNPFEYVLKHLAIKSRVKKTIECYEQNKS